MTSPPWRAVADTYWAREFGCDEDKLFHESLRLKAHGEALADYNGVFALFRDGRAIVSFPAEHVQDMAATLSDDLFSPERLAGHFSEQGYRVIGPAFIGYAGSVPEAEGDVRNLGESERSIIDGLREACSDSEWEHGGSEPGACPCSGSFEEGELAALSGYEIWYGAIAHLCVVTNPRSRGRGHAKGAVAHLAKRAIDAGLVPQYRTLASNGPSMKVGASLGFQPYAMSVAVRLGERTERRR